MARGFDSKFVEAQQDEAQRREQVRPALTPEQQQTTSRRQALMLSRARAAADLAQATRPAHKKMLEQAIEALDEQLAALGG
jgi:hypothetical protein